MLVRMDRRKRVAIAVLGMLAAVGAALLPIMSKDHGVGFEFLGGLAIGLTFVLSIGAFIKMKMASRR